MSFPYKSREFKKIHSFQYSLLSLKLIVFLPVFFYSNLVSAGQVTLAWDANTEPDLAGYMIYYGFATRAYDYVVDVGDQTTYTLSGLEDGHTYYFAVTAYDTEDLESDFSNEVMKNFELDNQPPTADAGPDQTVDEGVTVTLSGLNSTDPDDGIASYFWEQTDGPAVDLSNASSAESSFLAPDIGTEGQSLTFKLTVTDNGGLPSSDFCVINISWINEPPMADAGSDQTVDEGDVVALDGSSSADLDDGIASYMWEQTEGPSVTLSDNSAVQPTFIAPDAGSEGESLTFVLTVTDNGALKATDTCIVNVVGWVNIPPIAEAGSDQVASEGDTVMLDGSNSTDPDDGIASFQWTQKAGTPVTFDNPSAAQTFFTAPTVQADGEDLAIELTVTDIGGLQSTDNCIVTVTHSNSAPDLTGSWVSLKHSNYRRRFLIRANFKVENLGTQDATSSYVYFYLSSDARLDRTDRRIGKRRVDTLEAGQAVDISLKARYRSSVVYTYMIAQIDAGNTVSENDETNNIIVSWPL
jgi:hypothetical protein